MTLAHSTQVNGTAKATAITSGRLHLANLRQRSLATARTRLLWVVIGFVFFTLTAFVRIAQLGIVQQAPEHGPLGEALVPPRAEILDRNGVPLARAFPAYSLWFNPKALGENGSPLVKTPEEVARALSQIFPDLDYADVLGKLKTGKGTYLRRRVLPEEANKVFALGEPALEFPRETQRFYPQGSLAAHVLGYVDADGHGKLGMEEVLDQRLTDPAHRAEPVTLSIDSRAQGALEDELSRGMLETHAKGAAGIILDVDTGELISMASLPSFDPNRGDLARNALVFNRASNEVYELGSAFKPITIASAIDAGVVTDLAVRYSAAPLKIDGFTIHDSHNFGASLNVPEALIHSSNIVTAQVADKLGGARLRQTMLALGMNARPTVELPARGFPIWPKGDWPRLRTMTVSYGHGIAVTPLHLAAAYAALVNGGIWRPSTLYKVDPAHVPAGRRVFQASTSARIRQLLRLIVVDGTGRKADAPGFRVGGKTGSAEKAGGRGAGYKKTSLIATFAAAFPMDRPRYVVIAMLDEPQATVATSGQRTAAWNAAPIVGRVVGRVGPMLGVVPDAERDVDVSDLTPLVANGDGE
ncbi:peptidoglycan glycosyltransferase [Novosphingobium nitrogenifigens DSM 19370]|uniref:Peptidoglycan glycosyltransferase n=1 Tax=Novosphingobium nitrogenifigens DSM 19370 TaxID=983920 RepID=F1ZD58_9SPHN|nr:penicillin-binding protein 2 [Novosphingobium nitrogenifigens]EGD57347.1 peptidoglycan glycosyltransferase [Novosphingobium nitrogenifigens DSM 19370]